jgi:hypothetical protein
MALRTVRCFGVSSVAAEDAWPGDGGAEPRVADAWPGDGGAER